MCVGVSPPSQAGWGVIHPHTHTHTPRPQPDSLVALLLDITRPGCRGIRVAWYYTIDPCVAMPRGRHG